MDSNGTRHENFWTISFLSLHHACLWLFNRIQLPIIAYIVTWVSYVSKDKLHFTIYYMLGQTWMSWFTLTFGENADHAWWHFTSILNPTLLLYCLRTSIPSCIVEVTNRAVGKVVIEVDTTLTLGGSSSHDTCNPSSKWGQYVGNYKISNFW